jgi:hypothetical protein
LGSFDEVGNGSSKFASTLCESIDVGFQVVKQEENVQQPVAIPASSRLASRELARLVPPEDGRTQIGDSGLDLVETGDDLCFSAHSFAHWSTRFAF